MSDGERPESDERTVSIFAPETDAADFVANLLDDDRTAMAERATAAAESDLVVALGEGALSGLAAAEISTPVFPVRRATEATESALAAFDQFFDGTDDATERPVMRVETPERTTDALLDVSLTAATPGMISEFTVETDGSAGTDGEKRIDRVRADGVVVATPAGSRGYARAAGGPVVAAGSGVVTIVPIAPFATDPDHWVVPLSSLSVTVERDVDVSITVDGEPFTTLSPNGTVQFARTGTLRIVKSAVEV